MCKRHIPIRIKKYLVKNVKINVSMIVTRAVTMTNKLR